MRTKIYTKTEHRIASGREKQERECYFLRSHAAYTGTCSDVANDHVECFFITLFEYNTN